MSTITTKMIKDIIDTHTLQSDLMPADIGDLLTIPTRTVNRVLDGYEALIHMTGEDIEFLKRNKTNRSVYDAIIDLYGLESPFDRQVKPKKPEPEPKKEEDPQRDVLELIRKKMQYHKTRYWILQELLEEIDGKQQR